MTETSDMAAASTTTGASSAERAATSVLGGLVRTARPKQWSKNVLVFAAPGAAGVLGERSPLLATLTVFAVFCLASAGTYFLNDVLDREADRRHPRKRHRPIAAGAVPLPLAWVCVVLLPLAALTAASLARGAALFAVVALYIVLTVSYSVWLKHIAVVDLVAVAGGFVLRAIAGGVAADVPLSDWFLIVASFGSLFMIAGKRAAEHVKLGEARGETRAILEAYSLPFLRYVRSTSSAVVIAGYCLWAFERSPDGGVPWFQLSIAPFVMGILRYALLLEADEGEAPEDLVFGDRPLQVIGLLWLVLFTVGVYDR